METVFILLQLAVAMMMMSREASAAMELSHCISPLGMESGAIPDTSITASSSFEDSTVGPHNARIRVDKNGGAWCPKNTIGKEGKEWLEIDLGQVHVISATETQGRFGNGQGMEFTEAYMIEYFRPRLNKWFRYRTREENEVLDANTNTYVAVKNDLDPVILASRIRFHPYSHFKRNVCMRAEVYGCTWEDGVQAYSMPQGDSRGNSYNFYDYTYDGEWNGKRLINGLGCLTDGDYGPENFKLSYYAQNRGWVGWKKTPERPEMVEILFEFDVVREFHGVHVFTNNQFTRDVSVFKEARVLFSIGGKIFNSDPVFHLPMDDQIFEEPRNVTAKLHRRVAKFIKLQLFFRSKWIMISEVSFDSSVARGNYTPEVEAAEAAAPSDNNNKVSDVKSSSDMQQDNPSVVVAKPGLKEGEAEDDETAAFMPIVIGILASVIFLLAAIIFLIFIKTRNNRRKFVQMGRLQHPIDTLVEATAAEKMALNGNYGYDKNGFILTTTSDTGSSGSKGSSSRHNNGPHNHHQYPKLDDNYNTPAATTAMMTPRSLRGLQPTAALYSVSRNGSVHSHSTPMGGRKHHPQGSLPPPPRLHVPAPPPLPVCDPPEAVYTEPGLGNASSVGYMEPYRPMRYSPYYGYGPVLTQIEDSLMKQQQQRQSDTSCVGDDEECDDDNDKPASRGGGGGGYAIPIPRGPPLPHQQHHHPHGSTHPRVQQPPPPPPPQLPPASATATISPSLLRKKPEEEEGSLDRNGQKVVQEDTDSLRAMRSRLETHVVPSLTGGQLSLRQRLSEGSFGTVYIADAHGLPEYGGNEIEEGEPGKRLVAVKFLSEEASDEEKSEFIKEIRLLSVLEDPNISRVLGMCSGQEPYFVAMEYLEHGDLNQFLRCHLPEGSASSLPPGTRTLSLGTLIHMASQVASGMRYLESLNFVHRDLATRNCLVGKAYHLKICDFGSDNPLYNRDYFETDNHLLVPIRWMAWESVVMCKYTTKSDVWSYGVLLWEILQLASVRPFAALADEQVLDKLEAMASEDEASEEDEAMLDKPPICPKDLYELLCECWRRDPEDRPSFREIHLFLQRKNLGYSP